MQLGKLRLQAFDRGARGVERGLRALVLDFETVQFLARLVLALARGIEIEG